MTDIHSCSYYCDRPECVKAQRDRLRGMYLEDADAENGWKNAVVEELISTHIYRKDLEEQPRKALSEVINWHVAVALDPEVSSDAAALVESGKRKWQGLTDEEVDELWEYIIEDTRQAQHFARAIEAKLKEKNT